MFTIAGGLLGIYNKPTFFANEDHIRLISEGGAGGEAIGAGHDTPPKNKQRGLPPALTQT
jgi:hypothetical protein